MFHKILVAVDNSEMDRHVFDEAVSLAKLMNTRLMLLHVFYPFDEQFLNPSFVESEPHIFQPTTSEEASDKYDRYMKQWEEFQKEGREYLKSLNNEAKATDVQSEYTLKAGDPGRIICQVARAWEADLVIVGRRGHSGLSEFFLGSVSNYVLHHAPCSVLTIQGSVHTTTSSQMREASA